MIASEQIQILIDSLTPPPPGRGMDLTKADFAAVEQKRKERG